MTALKIEANSNIERVLIAGRRAALAALYDVERNKVIPGSIDMPPDSYDGVGDIRVDAVGDPVILNAAIDAAVLETLAQIQHPEPRPRPWWKFWA